MTSFASKLATALSKRTSFESVTTGINSKITRMDMTVPKTLRLCTTNAVVHCLNLPPSSNGLTATTRGAIKYNSSILKMRLTQLRIMVTRICSIL